MVRLTGSQKWRSPAYCVPTFEPSHIRLATLDPFLHINGRSRLSPKFTRNSGSPFSHELWPSKGSPRWFPAGRVGEESSQLPDRQMAKVTQPRPHAETERRRQDWGRGPGPTKPGGGRPSGTGSGPGRRAAAPRPGRPGLPKDRRLLPMSHHVDHELVKPFWLHLQQHPPPSSSSPLLPAKAVKNRHLGRQVKGPGTRPGPCAAPHSPGAAGGWGARSSFPLTSVAGSESR